MAIDDLGFALYALFLLLTFYMWWQVRGCSFARSCAATPTAIARSTPR